MSLWLPGFERWEIPGRPGVPYDEYDDPKCMWHSTEGFTIESAVEAYKPYPPHLCVDAKRRRKKQHISLSNAAYALWNEDADDSRCIQVEVVGFSKDAPFWPEEDLKWLGEEVARPLHELFGVPYVAVWKGFKSPADVNYVLASASSPLRLTQRELDSFSGHLAHQHSPGDSHWDVPFDIDKVLRYAQGSTEDDMLPKLIKAKGRTEIYEWHHTPQGPRKRHIASETELTMLRQAYGEARVNASITEFNLAEIQAMPNVLPVGTEVWNYKIPTEPGDTPKEFVQAHQLAAAINQNTAPEEES